MQNFRAALEGGLRDALRLRLALPLYLVGLVLGVLNAWPALIGASSGTFEHINVQRLLASSDMLTDLITKDESTGAATGMWVVIALLLVPLYAVAYNLFSGGVLSVWAGQRRFWAGCGHFFLSFTALGIMLVVLGLLVIVLASVVATLAPNAAIPTMVAAGILLQLLNLAGEYARALAVTLERQNPFVLLGKGVAFCATHPGALLLGLAGLAIQLGLVAAHRALDSAASGAAWLMLLDQAVVLVWLWAKLLRLAWARAYVASAHPPAEAAPLLAATII
ncbi:hypothetical protein F8S13_03180 [Chloroflexia bacterium SDU3-3]|nr:hypothetical protein F8S13_03180 [Chloroflexia bacterium SDU3-3]